MNDGADFLELAVRDGHQVSGKSLAELETVIERGQQTFIEVGRALLEIRDGRLYRETYTTFEAYCRERWGWGRHRANQYISGARVAEAVGDHGYQPESEREARAMLDRLEPEERERVRAGTASRDVAQKLTQPIRRPKAETPSEHDQVIELVRRQLADLRERYAIVYYWQPVWDAIDEINRRKK